MSQLGTINVSEVHSTTDIRQVPQGLSFFQPYLEHSITEVLEVGGECFVSRNTDGAISGIFIYDEFEKTGTVYTRSREIFEHFYEMKPLSFLWSELKTEHESEAYDIYAVDLAKLPIEHSFNHEISVATDSNQKEIERFMAITHPGINPNWVKVAMKNGDKCLLAKLNSEIAGIAWLSLVNGIGRLFSLHVNAPRRRMGMGEDLLFARLLWLKSMRARSAFSEISSNNPASARISMKGHMSITGHVYQYYGKDHGLSKTRENPRALV